MLSIIFAILLLFFGSCGIRSDLTSSVARPPEPVLSADVAIFSPEQAAELWYLFPSDSVTYWQVQPTEVAQLEADLEDFLLATPEYEMLATFAEDYQRQYFGYEQDGERFIYGNFFCNSFGGDWRETWIEVADGGDCYFSFSYQMSNRSFQNFYVNGEA